MTAIFLNLLNISIMAGWTLLAILLLRLVLRKAPKWTVCLLWAILAIRLVLPFSFESSFSLLPSSEVIPTDITLVEAPAINSGIPQLDSAVNPVLLQQAEQPITLEQVLNIASIVWLVGVGIMLLYSAASWLLLRLRLQASLRYRDNIYLCDDIQSPFVFGVFAPRIYLPSGLNGAALQYVLAHENAHIQRRDHLWKPLGYLLLSVYWFNPLLWIAYILLCRDIERACDEKVLERIGDAGKAGYANALLECSAHRRMILTCPVAFGEVSVASRVKSALSYKKPAVWIVTMALLVCGVTVMCFLTNPESCPHIYSIEVNAASTCTHKGTQTRTCQLCEHSYMEYIEMCPHTPGQTAVLQEPSCTFEGKAAVTCADCGTVYTQTLPKAPDVHLMQEVSIVESTCALAGCKTFECTYCGHEERQALPLLEHQYTKEIAFHATCTKAGTMKYRCSQCKDTYEEKIPKTDHTWVHWYNNVYRCSGMLCTATKNTGSSFSLTDDITGRKPITTPQYPVIKWDTAH